MATEATRARTCERCGMLDLAHWDTQAVLEEPVGLHPSPNLDGLWCPPEAGTRT